MKSDGHKVRVGKLSEFRPQSANANKHTERGLRMLDDAMSEDGYVAPATATADGEVIDGSARLERAYDKFKDEAIIIEHDGTKPIIAVRTDIPNANTKEAKRIAVRANRIAQVDLEWNPEVLAQLTESKEIEGLFTDKELAEILTQTGVEPGIEEGAARLTLSERFLIPPFSVLDARQGYWQDRKRAWIALGIQSELGRGGDVGRRAEGDGDGLELLSQAKLSPGGSPRPAMKLRNGHTVRGDGRGREI